jgi:hypothetical protein
MSCEENHIGEDAMTNDSLNLRRCGARSLLVVLGVLILSHEAEACFFGRCWRCRSRVQHYRWQACSKPPTCFVEPPPPPPEKVDYCAVFRLGDDLTTWELESYQNDVGAAKARVCDLALAGVTADYHCYPK